RGFFFPATASSDSHRIDTDEPGYSRTYAYVNDRDLKKVDIADVVESLKSGRSFVTNGPIVELTVNDRYLPGDTAAAVEEEVEIHFEVRAAPWILVEEARLYVNREIVRVFPVEAGADPVRRLVADVHLELADDAFIVVEVVGKGSLYPVVQVRTWSGLQADAVTPYALTNPVFVDVDGNGRFDPPLPRTIQLLPAE
ncbi:MAG: CehA/McbA family metallohydrolase, partial [Acidimicrobiales bacterium]